MSQCRWCKSEMQEGALFCSQCGREDGVDLILCYYCKSEKPKDAKVCPRCLRDRDSGRLKVDIGVWDGVKIGVGMVIVLPLIIIITLFLLSLGGISK